MTDRVSLYAELEARPHGVDEVATALGDYAQRVRRELGNLAFAAHQREDDPHRFFVYESYADPDAFAAHLDSAHCASFNERVSPLLVGGASTLTRLNPELG